MLDVRYARALDTNYVWLVTGPDQRCAIVDPGDAGPVFHALENQRLTPEYILITHHHPDHVNGAPAIQDHFGIPIFGPDDSRVPGDTRRLHDGEQLALDALEISFEVLFIPGHTKSHIAFYGEDLLLSGDTLFSAGCGRLFEGTADEMTDSLDKLAGLPPETRLYCGHEYTLANCAFARQVEPHNADLKSYEARARVCLDDGRPSLPTTLNEELAVNPFLRTAEAAVIEAAEARAGRKLATEAEVFGVIRAWKDDFRG